MSVMEAFLVFEGENTTGICFGRSTFSGPIRMPLRVVEIAGISERPVGPYQ